MPFKECPNCDVIWENRDAFLQDPCLSLVGYQVNYGDLNAGIFLFNHDTKECGTSLAIEASEFTDMHEGPIFEVPHDEVAGCPGYCGKKNVLDDCKKKCECSYVRDVLERVRDWPKTNTK